MDHRTPFDKAIDDSFSPRNCCDMQNLISTATEGKNPEDVRDSLVFVVDVLRHCWLGALHVFDNPKPEITFQIYDRVLARLQTIDPVRSEALRIRAFELEEYHRQLLAATPEERARMMKQKADEIAWNEAVYGKGLRET